MINRSLIRLKVLQLLYAYYQDGDKGHKAIEKELLLSMGKAYDLYNYMLLLMISITRYANEVLYEREERNKVIHDTTPLSHRFVDNRFIIQLECNKELQEFNTHKHLTWDDKPDYIKYIYNEITSSKLYADYMSAEEDSYEQDKSFWRHVYKNIIMKDERIYDLLEEESLYWNDDKEIIDTFVVKTIKKFRQEEGADQQLMPEFRDEEDREFAIRLMNRTIINDKYYRSLIRESTRNWDYERIAFMDVLLMQMAISEMLSFPEIPVHVTIYEYIELANMYSTPKSGKFINGILDHISRRLHAEGNLLKPIKDERQETKEKD